MAFKLIISIEASWQIKKKRKKKYLYGYNLYSVSLYVSIRGITRYGLRRKIFLFFIFHFLYHLFIVLRSNNINIYLNVYIITVKCL